MACVISLRFTPMFTCTHFLVFNCLHIGVYAQAPYCGSIWAEGTRLGNTHFLAIAAHAGSCSSWWGLPAIITTDEVNAHCQYSWQKMRYISMVCVKLAVMRCACCDSRTNSRYYVEQPASSCESWNFTCFPISSAQTCPDFPKFKYLVTH